MLNTKILIVEDEVLIADYIAELLEEEKFTTIKMAHDEEVATFLMETFIPEIILMDINLNGKNSGIELAKSKKGNTKVIFLTGQYDYKLMNDALQTNPDSYLTKPIKKQDLIAAVNLAIIKLQTNFIIIKDGYNDVKINLDDILFVKSDGNYIDLQLINKKYAIRKSLDAFLEDIQSKDFIKIHRSYIINRTKISKKNSTSVFINEIEIPLSRNLDFEL
ncbi:response regulator transcription factor [Flavobacterium jejuense]|uniref:Response regulator transcription factor n=1 Tax=Flavobacterium jejuense TaxID=1544455 RepID=A0ABX0IW48_9FLAO|nr:response regulator transcription factor [Flavobacterium jejuense]NHN28102.1 response regulator transcription factor [Flavobacterium jejuense]